MLKFVALVSSALMVASAVSVIPGDNSHYKDGDRFIWFPDGHGVPVLVDLFAKESPFDMSRSSTRGASNIYYLYTRSNAFTPQQLILGDINSLSSSNFDVSKSTKIIVHGWNNNKDSDVNSLVYQAFLEDGDYNVIVIDWSHTSYSLYTTCVSSVPDIGAYIGQFLAFLNANGAPYSNMHLVGHSLGAHIVGNAGRYVAGQVGRITGLDPAGPLFPSNDDRLTSSDAQLVEAIHTDAGFLGYWDPLGDLDFYPNGGHSQPGCWLSTCHHGRAYEFFAATLKYNNFLASQCTDVNQATSTACSGAQTEFMGNSLMSKTSRGIFRLETSSSYPYAL